MFISFSSMTGEAALGGVGALTSFGLSLPFVLLPFVYVRVYRPVERFGHYAEATNFSVNLRYEEFTRAANLLRFRFDESTGTFVALHDALHMKLDARALVCREVINRDELFPMPQHLAQPHGSPEIGHGPNSR